MSWAELDSIEGAAGGQFADFQGTRLPNSFSAPESEWQAVRHASGVLDGRTRRVLSLVGNDRVGFLHGMVSNHIKKLADGQGTYATLLTIQGRIVSDLYVYATADCLLLDVPAACADAVREALERFIIADDVEFAADGVESLLAIEGPQAPAVLATVAGRSVDGLHNCDHREITIGGVPVRCVSVSQSGEAGFRLLGPVTAAAPLWQRLVAAGATPVGLDALNVLRLEAGIPWHGIDMDAETLVMEVGLDAAISFNKGCYLGQEVVERVAARGQANRKLCGLSAAGTLVPLAGAPLIRDGKEVGHITSAVHSPALARTIALGYVHRSALDVGTALHAQCGERLLKMIITALPFYRSAATSNAIHEEETSHGKPIGQTLPV